MMGERIEKKCGICNCSDTMIVYEGKIRDGGLGKYTNNSVLMYKCKQCGVIWHDKMITDIGEYYESEEYRKSLEGSSEEEEFYQLHDKETLEKLRYTGTTIFRNKIVADVGCGCGAFLDFLKGVVKDIVAIEPSKTYRKIMDCKGFHTYAYAEDARDVYKEKIDVITSFDVIEHVENPQKFLTQIFDLLKEDGRAIIGTPTDAPAMRELLGKTYEEKLLFSTQHLWIFGEANLKLMAERAGFCNVEVKYFQRYGIGNVMGWLREKEPHADICKEFLTGTLNAVWKSECEDKKISDYIVLYLKK